MNTFLSPAQQASKEQYEAYVREHLQPIARQLDDRTASAKEFLTKIGQSGFLGMTVPKEYGGQSASFLQTILFVEAVGSYQPGIALAIAEHTAVIELIARFGTDTQKSRYLPLLARGECLGATAFNEETAGSDFKAVQSEVGKDGLSGRKTAVVNAANANLVIISAINAQTDVLSLFLAQINGASVQVGEERRMIGMHSIGVHDMTFKAHELSADAALQQGSAEEQIMFAGDVAKTIVAAAALGVLESAIAVSVDHANTREQFGQKIGQFQAVQWKLADMSVETSASRLLVYRAAWAKDEDAANFRKEAAMCKWYATKCARVHSGEAIQILGAAGLSAESPAEQLYRDSKFMEITEGTSEIQKVILAQELDV